MVGQTQLPGECEECLALVLQGGGALGAYQAGAFQALSEAGYDPHWIAGISIGAVNGAIIAGNAPENRLPRLRDFWNRVSSELRGRPGIPGILARRFFGEMTAALACASGIPGFFTPRFPPPLFMPGGTAEAISYYDTTPLKRTLDELVDFDLLNRPSMRLSLGAVNVETGNFEYFDTTERRLRPEHIMASSALPPGFPPVVIEGRAYWDGGLVSNTPLQYVLDRNPRHSDLCAFQVDLFNARGRVPETMADVYQREKDIRYSSRTRLNTDVFRNLHRLRCAAHRLHEKLPDDLKDDPAAKALREAASAAAITIVHLIYRRAAFETESKDYEFSRLSVDEHWKAGRDDVLRTLRHESWRRRQAPPDGVQVFDLTRQDSG